MRILTVIVLSFLLSGCAIFDIFKTQEDKIQLHPELPRPISSLQIDWFILESNQEIVVGTQYQEFLKLLEHQNDMTRYLEQINETLCFYRKDLEESICTPTKGKKK